jgi:ankyrin repeat protein
LSAAADVDENGNTPLHLAALRGDAEEVDALLARGADAKAANKRGGTPLHYGSGSERIVRALLAAGAKADILSEDGMTPLMSAVMRGTAFPVAKLLVDAGADVNAAHPDDKIGTLALAIFGGDRRTVRLLLERGAKPDAKGEVTPLAQATFVGDIDTVRLLLDRGVDVNTPEGFFGSCLNLACYSGHPAIAELLIERGAKLDTPSIFGQGTPPMVWSAYNEHGDPTLARLLVSHGADINASNLSGETALSYALKRGSATPLVQFLREAGAKPTPVAREKKIPSRDVPAPGPARDRLVRSSAQHAIDRLQQSSKVFHAPRA